MRFIHQLSILLLILNFSIFSQNLNSKNKAIRTGLGIGYNQGIKETGNGFLVQIGTVKNIGNTQRLRLAKSLSVGNYSNFGITDIREQYYRMSRFSVNCDLDIIKYKTTSLVLAAGPFLNFSRGILGTGGWRQTTTQSEKFYQLYYGLDMASGLRFVNPKGKYAIEILPINISVGNNGYELFNLKIGVDFILK